jgi:2-oxoisovalerate dehydrogenase E2 component (dihydrolipoyl transacylase)
MERDFELPDVGEGLEEATIVEWHVRPGDHVSLNEPICAIETAKAEVELPSPFAGTVLVTNGAPGDTLRVGEVLIRFDLDDTGVNSESGADSGVGADGDADHMPTLVGYGVGPGPATNSTSRQWPRRDAAPADAASGQPAPVEGRPMATPPVRKLAKDLGVDLETVIPTGSRGEMTRDDVRAASGNGPSSGASPRPERGSSSEIPVRGVRARIANRMSVSRSTIPEATCGVWVDCANLLDLRERFRAADQARDTPAATTSITPFSIIAWLAVRALSAAPLFNASFRQERDVIEVHGSVHLGIATSTEQGLMVVVIRDADTLELGDFSEAVVQLTHRARSGTLTPHDLTGSTFTVNNYGALGLDDANPIINYPEAAILGVGSIRSQPAVVDGEVVPRPLFKLVASFDHRVCDGAEAGRYLSRLKNLVEHPELALPDGGVSAGGGGP